MKRILAILVLFGLTNAGAVAVAASANPPWSGIPTRTSVRPHSGAGDPINIALEGSRARILDDFARIHWVVADPLSVRHDTHLAEAALHHGSYTHAPVSNLYLFGRSEDFAVEHELGWVGRRDHARFWDTGKQDSVTHQELWVGGVSRDIGIKILFHGKRPAGTTHEIDGNLDAERNLLVSEFKSAGVITTVLTRPGVGKVSNGTTGGGSHYSTDGQVDVVVLK